MSANNSGTATTIVFLDTVETSVLCATTVTSQATTAGNTVLLPSITYTANQSV